MQSDFYDIDENKLYMELLHDIHKEVTDRFYLLNVQLGVSSPPVFCYTCN